MSTKSPAFLVALSIAVILDPCSLAAFSKKALNTWVEIFFGSNSSNISSSSGSNSYEKLLSLIVNSIDQKKVNLDGGALALGHPLGATGARITGKAADLLRRENKKYALATQCIGLGMGIATIIETIN